MLDPPMLEIILTDVFSSAKLTACNQLKYVNLILFLID